MEPRTCRCGYDKDHYMVAPTTRYGFWGMVALVMLAGGATPRSVAFVCQRCDEVVWESSDPATCKAHRS